MTVVVQPVPPRVARNGIRPFRPVVPINNIRSVTVKTWRPPMPEPLPPAPLLGPKALLGLGLLVLAQIWGYFNRKPEQPRYPMNTGEINGSYGNYGGTVDKNGTASPRRSCSTGAVVMNGWTITANQGIGASNSYGIRWETFPLETRTVCGGSNTLQSKPWLIVYKRLTADGPWVESARSTGEDGEYPALYGWGQTITYSPQLKRLTFNGADLPLPTTGDPIDRKVPKPAPLPQLPPGTAPTTTPSPAPLPVPEPEPEIVPITPGPIAPPTIAPPEVPRVRPPRLPGSRTTQDGALVPITPAPATTTAPDAHFPVPGAPPVTGNGPRPTPEGIAQELGRLEQKVARLSNPQTDATGDASDRIGLALKLLGDIVEFFNSITAGGGYVLSSPCEVDAAGNRIPVQVNYAGAPTALGVISNKLDAVAALLQAHKDLKQPICRQTPAVGESVTVQFVQVD